MKYQLIAHHSGTHYRMVINERTAGYVWRTRKGWTCDVETHGWFRARAVGRTRDAAVRTAITACGPGGGVDLIALRSWAA